jgi:lipopolysaccharide export system ATP-binding protein
VRDLVKSYGGRTVVDRVSYAVYPGEIIGLLGRNGAGKTTSFRITIGMITAEGGTVMFNGQDITNLPMYKRAQLGMGYLSQEPSIFQRLTVQQNLMAIFETIKTLSRQQRRRHTEELMDQFGLAPLRHQQARTLSGGERRKLEIARALITDPRLILLDEPFSGVDPIAVEDLQREIHHLQRERGISILLTDHNVRETLSVTNRSYIIDEGRVLRQGSPRELINDDLVRKTYLGSTFRGDEFDEGPAVQTSPQAANRGDFSNGSGHSQP